ncbi:serine hydrolase domain-containing protein [Lacticaseibacillus daqingensis]|uniref:serine hydrolase domain-containing protein n=1 Tax=Lacticaseibacillus daqingensis TaxID=2486014 RepID=UPI0013DE4EEE|nr:serine hydrolase domain-containing protein [Lacticaseibacillus daqingensis]
MRKLWLVLTAAVVGGMLAGGGWWLGRVTAPEPAPMRPLPRPKAKRTVAAPPATAIDQPLQRALTHQLAALDVSGTAVLIRKSRVVATYTHGWADAARRVPNGLNTMYEIDSVQKSLTAGLFMQQVAAGKVSLTTPLGHFYPRFAQSPITMAHLLHMNSGLRMKGVLTPPLTTDAALVAANVAKLIDEPSHFGQYQYTPINYLLLAGITEQLTGMTYEQLVQEHYIDALHLTHTRMAYALRTSDPAALGYAAGASATPVRPSLASLHAELGTGQLYMSALDYYQAARALVNGQLLGTARQALYAPGPHYGGGFYLTPTQFAANGTGYGFFGTVNLSTDGQTAAILFSNVQVKDRAPANAAMDALMTRLMTPGK